MSDPTPTEETVDAALAELKQTTVGYLEYEKLLAAGKYTPKDGSGTHWGKGVALLSPLGSDSPNNPTSGGGFAPLISAAPVLTGSPAYQGTLSVTNGSWTNSPTSYTYQWYTGATPIVGAVGSTHVVGLVDSLAQSTLSCQVTAHNGAGASTPEASNAIVGTPFLYSSTMNTPLPGGVAIHADSAAMIQGNSNFVSTSPAQWMTPSDRTAYVGPVTFSTEPQETFNINFTAAGGESCRIGGTTANVPWPAWMTPVWEANDQDSDSISYVFESGAGDTWGGYRSTVPGDAPRDISNSGACASGTGTYNAIVMTKWAALMAGVGYNSLYAFASASCIAAGLITPGDLANVALGLPIPHALVFAAALQTGPGDVHPTVVAPAQASANGGQQSGTEAWPTGARAFLDCTDAQITGNSDILALSGTATSGLRGFAIAASRAARIYGALYVDGTGAGAAGLQCGYPTTPGSGPFPNESGSSWNYYTTYIPISLWNSYGKVVDWTEYT